MWLWLYSQYQCPWHLTLVDWVSRREAIAFVICCMAVIIVIFSWEISCLSASSFIAYLLYAIARGIVASVKLQELLVELVTVGVERGESTNWSESWSIMIASHLHGGQLFAVVSIGGFKLRENCFFKTSMYGASGGIHRFVKSVWKERGWWVNPC